MRFSILLLVTFAFSSSAFAQLSATPAGPMRACAPGSWYAVSSPTYDYAYRWCDDTDLMVGFINGLGHPTLGSGLHLIYDGVTHGVAKTTPGYESLIFGFARGATPHIPTPNTLKFKMWGSYEHGCGYDPAEPDSPNYGYDQAVVEVSAYRSGAFIYLEIDIDGVMYLLFPSTGLLKTVEDSGVTMTQSVPSMSASPDWHDLASATQYFTSLGTLGIQMHTDTAGEMHFQNHGTLLEVDFDHICDHDPLPPKPQLTVTTRIRVESLLVEDSVRHKHTE